ncbi:putative E3 ubiquitin-protein ligase LIN-1 isoform X2 [Humulus lupulus]|uniref:putative E3 ubiquitin-protein ligase LIN-1 isoform X2 n=1 Tax=Humulus lupulus TaxID=3486 RepID=UPI002B416651|nr:putative E3 ubiquitin-protein ligase LIN-1 isoform X2 [Humulus lupulus]
MTTTSASATSSQILHHTSTFVSETLSQAEIRRRLFSVLRRKLTLSPSHDSTTLVKSLNLAAETLDNAVTSTSTTVRSSCLRLIENLLLSHPENSVSSLLLSLTYGLWRRPVDAALSLLDVFRLDPSSARSEIAPTLFEELFLIHLLPVLHELNERRSKILSSATSPPNIIITNTFYDDDYSINDEMAAIPSTKSLSKMSDEQASELKRLETEYEEVIDDNCRVLAKYLKEVLENEDDNINRLTTHPPLTMMQITSEAHDHDGFNEDRPMRAGELSRISVNGRYNPIWTEGERSAELFNKTSSSKAKSLPFYPQRVSPQIFSDQKSSWKFSTSPKTNSYSELESSLDDNRAESSSEESEAETEERNRNMALFESRESQTQKQEQPVLAESSRSPDNLIGKQTPPKDFVCPITSNVFNDPVTLETGQTYERRAIQEWLDRGNDTCPITRQELQNTQLPKTNYVLKRLIGSWQELNPGSVAVNQPENLCTQFDPAVNSNSEMPSTSPNSVISQATMEGTSSELRHAISNLCTSEILKESEAAVLRIERFWQEANMEQDIQIMLSKPPVVNGFVEILFNSVDSKVLRATIFLLSEMGSRDKAVIQTLTQVDSDVECIAALLKKGLTEAVVLIYLLRTSILNLTKLDLLDSLLMVIKTKDRDLIKMCVKPKTAAVILLGQIFESYDETTVASIVNSMISEKEIESVVDSLGAESSEERVATVRILVKCMQVDGKCRNNISNKAELAPVLESLMGPNDGERFEMVNFLSELVKLNRRTFNNQILHIIKDEGPLSTMHALLVYLQTAPEDQCPTVAGLLLQLDLLTEPRKMSIYREEAIDTLIACLRNTDFPGVQLAAAETIMSLQGRFTTSGKSLTRATLLKRAGLDKSYNNLVRIDQLSSFSADAEESLEEEKAADNWERKMASVLVSHEFGLLFEALSEGLRSTDAELCSTCFISATWLVDMLKVLPDTGVRGAARVCLLKRFASIFKSSRDTENKTLSLLALTSFIQEPEGLHELNSYLKDIFKGLRELKKSTPLALEMLKIVFEGQDSSADLWSHKQLVQVDCSENGEVLSVVSFKDKFFSGHSDGTIKVSQHVWTGKGSILHLIQEIREHTKAITSLTILPAAERLYSGSLDRTSRVWSISDKAINCIQVHEMKDQVHNLVVANTFSCFIPHGSGVKVHSWNGSSKLLNAGKHVKCLALVQGKLYCGCQDSSIQEIDLATETVGTIQGGSRKLLGKASPVHALQIYGDHIYAASTSLDGTAVKILSTSDYSMVGSLATALEVRVMAISSELIYLGCKKGNVEIWNREKWNRIDTLQSGSNCRVLCMALDSTEEVLVFGTSDGQIQAWGLS